MIKAPQRKVRNIDIPRFESRQNKTKSKIELQVRLIGDKDP